MTFWVWLGVLLVICLVVKFMAWVSAHNWTRLEKVEISGKTYIKIIEGDEVDYLDFDQAWEFVNGRAAETIENKYLWICYYRRRALLRKEILRLLGRKSVGRNKIISRSIRSGVKRIAVG